MAATYTPADGVTYAKLFVKKLPIDAVTLAYPITDDINKIIWMFAPWRWTLGAMTSVSLVSDTQDYTVTLPADFLYLAHAYITDGIYSTPVRVEPFLPSIAHTGDVTRVAITSSTNLRVYPRPGTLVTPTKKLVLIYKKTSPLIAAGNYSTAGALVMDDEWFWVFREGVLWLSYKFADDPRAGGAVVGNDGRVQYNGQYGAFMAALNTMREHEKLPLFDERTVDELPTVRR